MAKSTTGRSRFKMQRSLGIELPGLGKSGALKKRNYGPGVHGNTRKRISDYAIRLKEKQKILYHYGLREKQLINYIKLAKKNKTRAWMDTLIIKLEQRLNNVIFRLNWAPSILAASQMISHQQVLINDRKVDRSSYIVQKNDILTLTTKGYKNQLYKRGLETPRMASVPACFEIDGKEAKKAVMIDYPIPTDIPFEFVPQLMIEYYWKIKS